MGKNWILLIIPIYAKASFDIINLPVTRLDCRLVLSLGCTPFGFF
ncbi:hypothetical protein BTURTLESOX_527 [bacterium endosymbiont of Bathymodiolus sp. 5 South]|nr:hypothetical protein BTURTLESOX_527 [bacterium endosymbiont of Bathymodiolus sp. 5 South]VVH58208.1 hypothetical protein BSPCLSOX_2908 [uncultured Gammaproteobacteria bacterium]VVH62858.1 hypothetical protein BSPWISOX_1329 [uncultured Gammaproteobacteria bacterium]